ncbi:LysR family transcriptional regulator [Streptomyces sp. AS58]|uniref:LysR family transcriptional regulator n=1 Tax=Streptomyces cadmiisoli TaxID=2184053 RepID=A0A2Z4IV69_9ACTN|nr:MULTISPECIES: SDR family oxidoreductase [Streptomyces]AWW36083.1 LysR family transcriptional regulator [Streptomyces cadmiisoli]KOV74582.1 LysR family transcriptional regulator [Streptomyces sp. AS58]
MKFTVLGGSGLIGSQVVEQLTAAGHEVTAASLSTGVDVISGKGLKEVLAGADAVINLTNSPVFDETSIGFFETSMNNVVAAAEEAGLRHHVILSIVGLDEVPGLDYYRAKMLQEDILTSGPTPYSIVRATQFFEFVQAVLSMTTEGDVVRLPATPVQPMASADVVAAVVRTATGTPVQGVRNVAGPEMFHLDELGRVTLAARPDGRHVVTDAEAGMFAVVPGDALLPPPDAQLAATRYGDWLEQQPPTG